ncbi:MULTISPECIES: hypothetical protein [Vibrio]|nr:MULTISPECIES: hypothetical protein [Vibrio]
MIQINLANGLPVLLFGILILMVGGAGMLYYAYKWDEKHKKDNHKKDKHR